MTVIAVIDKTGRIPQAEMDRAIAAFQIQVSRDLYPVYGVDATILSCRNEYEAPSGAWFTWIVDIMDEEGLNGYHFVDNMVGNIVGTGAKGYAVGTASGNPFGLVKYSSSWTITCSHEIIEKLVNPYLDRQVTNLDVDKDGNASEDLLMEIADPVQANAYQINNILVSNFVYPEYYTDALAIAGKKYDHIGVIKGPLEIAEGGYYSFKRRGGQWWQGFKTLNVVLYKSIAEGRTLTSVQAERLVRQICWGLVAVMGLLVTITLIKRKKNNGTI